MLNNPITLVRTSFGTYTGDNSANRAIAHGLSHIPRLVLILCTTTATRFQLGLEIRGSDSIFGTDFSGASIANTDVLAVTAKDNVSFYVGNATDQATAMNQNTLTYFWFAVGEQE